MKRNLVISVLK